MTYKQSYTRTPSQTLGLHNNSHTISKIQPKIRIIHIYAPEIIETDVANFRELVQRLTGKPAPSENRPQDKGKGRGKPKKTSSRVINRDPYPLFNDNNNINININDNNNNMPSRTTITGSSSSPSSSCDHLNHDDDQGFWRTSAVDHTNNNTNNTNNNNNTSGGFLSAFNDDIDDHFDLSSMFTMNTFGDNSQLSFRG
ncbi:hypothetical protein RND81_14G055400 [Saponaria officinalis]|uniref:VQ domain-containing protein n=1 Tax=Saponaria officinalis TaxID=3572 RepID=A0AAW1GIP9_SAPOF